MKTVTLVLLWLVSAVALPVMAYDVPEEDLVYVKEPTAQDMEYVRCKGGACYFIKTGEWAGLSAYQDGVYLVWSNDEPAEEQAVDPSDPQPQTE